MPIIQPRPEYPRPQFVRKEWINLNGLWGFEMDPAMSGKERGLLKKNIFDQKILVPFCPESVLSGIGHTDFMNAVWYKKTFELPSTWKQGKTLLHIGACDYETEVWVNGTLAGTHIGGYTPFSLDITKYLEAMNAIVICAKDDVRSANQPAGKQSAQYASHGCMYTRTTGIWQTVWLEHVPVAYIKQVKYTPDIDTATLYIEAECECSDGMTLSAESFFEDYPTGRATAVVHGSLAMLALKLSDLRLWDIGSPNLYTLKLSLGDDHAESYFGMRSVSFHDKKFYLNHRSVFQRLVLDQGFYPDGIYTAASDEILKRDIELSMAMGFNGARLHQKVFEPRFLYYCDLYGYMVWDEMGNWGLDMTRPAATRAYTSEWLEVLLRDYNHPAIIGWCPFNETPAQQDAVLIRTIYHITKAYDKMRPVIDCSGWHHIITDIVDGHDYEQNPEIVKNRLKPLIEDKPLTEPFYLGDVDSAELCFMSEYGGTHWKPSSDSPNAGGAATNPFNGENIWGYGTTPDSIEAFIERFRGLTTCLLEHPRMCGFCYTQLTDVEQEQNGLYTYHREAKFSPDIIRAIVTQKAAAED